MGLASRREAEDWIRAGRLSVNGTQATLGLRVAPSDQVRLDGRVVRRHEAPQMRIFICHRSPGETLGRPHEEPDDAAMASRLPGRAGPRFIAVSPMPRIDGGLELLTSDGELAVKLQRAARHVASEFSVRVRGELTRRAARRASSRGSSIAARRSRWRAARAQAARAPTAGTP